MMIFLLPLLFILGCSSVNQIIENPYYKRDMIICEGGKCHEGVAVLPPKFKYELEIKLKGQADLFTANTCAREFDNENAWVKKFWPDKKRVDFDYKPSLVEETRNCDLHLGGFEKIKGRHSWALIAFEYPKIYTLPARVFCNGESVEYKGVSICQSKAGLVQQIQVSPGSKYKKSKDCPDLKELNPGQFEYNIGLGECTYSIYKEDKIHRHISVGYQSILIRDL